MDDDARPKPADTTTLSESYASVYKSLVQLREAFHRSGRFDDSNSKLDEVAKLLSSYIAFRRGLLPSFPNVDPPRHEDLIPDLHAAFKVTAQLPGYLNQHGESIFGLSPSLSLREGDEALAVDLVHLVIHAVDSALLNQELNNPFDLLNEAFGHFVRDNFRSNTEDAQYLTPPEVVDFMVELAVTDLENAGKRDGCPDPFIVADPTCGVGSFLAAFYHRAKRSPQLRALPLDLVGQDKVDRMVRLATINLAMFDVPGHSITIGNSLLPDTPLAEFNGRADLILTNPPFGAKFSAQDVALAGIENLPLFCADGMSYRTFDSELLFVDRNLALLREGGRMLIVLPDGAVSARGLASTLRQNLKTRAIVHGIIELPPVTFAQAGTRTRTVVLYLQKRSPRERLPESVFIARANSLGFEVRTRKGVPIKTAEGENELIPIVQAYKSYRHAKASDSPPNGVLNEAPSAVSLRYDAAIERSWTPNHYNAIRIRALETIERIPGVNLVPLNALVEFESSSRKATRWSPGSAFISVLHVMGEGLLDISAVNEYAPKTPGYIVHPREILLSRINPRIPRVMVVPPLAKKILCSAEFEIMRPREGLDPYTLCFLLMMGVVQDQIRSLTSGTSASHNRIKARELAEIQLPIPPAGSETESRLTALSAKYRESTELLFEHTRRLASLRVQDVYWGSEAPLTPATTDGQMADAPRAG